MSAVDALTPCFVEEVPDALEPGLFYVSLEHGSMMHLCACGCGHEIALPLTPLDWRFTYNGETVSVSPSVGNWSLPCRSHYVIDRGRVRWAEHWTDAQVEAGRRDDKTRKGLRFGKQPAAQDAPKSADPLISDRNADGDQRKSVLKGLRVWIDRLWRP